jgi:hypothetical protein
MKIHVLLVSICFTLFINSELAGQYLRKQWDKTLGGSGLDQFTCIIQTSDNGYLVGGFSNSMATGEKSENSKGVEDFWIIKTDQYGRKQWDKTFGGPNSEILNKIIPTDDGGYILAGSSISSQSGDKTEVSFGSIDYWVIKIDKNGSKEWDKEYGGDSYDQLSTFVVTDFGYILGGLSYSGPSGNKSSLNKGASDYWIIAIDKNGNKLWDKSYGGAAADILVNIIVTTEGYVLAGTSSSGAGGDKSADSKGNSDYWIIKIDKNGNKISDRTFGGDNYDECFSIVSTTDGGFLVGGRSSSSFSGDKTDIRRSNPGDTWSTDYWIVKMDNNLNKLWDKTFGGTGTDVLYSIQNTPDRGFLLIGNSDSNIEYDKSQPNIGSGDGWIIKIDEYGTKLWDQVVGGSSIDNLVAISTTADLGYIIGGYSYSNASGDKSENSNGGWDYWIIKVGSDLQSPLPIKLLSYTIENHNCMLRSEWRASDALELIKYKIKLYTETKEFSKEFSISDGTNYNQSYSNTIEIPSEFEDQVFYAQLLLFERDGTETASDVRVIKGNCRNKNYSAFVYPNPTKNYHKVNVVLNRGYLSGTYAVHLYDQRGRLCEVLQVKLENSTNFPINFKKKLVPGLYNLLIINVNNSDENLSLQFVNL